MLKWKVLLTAFLLLSAFFVVVAVNQLQNEKSMSSSGANDGNQSQDETGAPFIETNPIDQSQDETNMALNGNDAEPFEKLSSDLVKILNRVSNDTVLLVWVDYNASLQSEKVFNLTCSIMSLGVRTIGAVFSPNREYVWYLVETTADKVNRIVSIGDVAKASLAKEGEWEWGEWWYYRKIGPVLELQAERMRNEYPNEMIEVDLWFNITSDKETDLNRTITLIASLGGSVTWVGLLDTTLRKGQIVALIPLEAIDVLAAHDSILRIGPVGPLIPE